MQSLNRILCRILPAVALAAVPAAMLLMPFRAAADDRIDDRFSASRLDDRLGDARIQGLRLSREAVEEEEIVSTRRVAVKPTPARARERVAASRLLKTRRVAATVR